MFTLSAIETLGTYGGYAIRILEEIRERISDGTGEVTASSFPDNKFVNSNGQSIIGTMPISRSLDESDNYPYVRSRKFKQMKTN